MLLSRHRSRSISSSVNSFVLRASRLELSVIKDGGAAEKVEHIDVELINDGKTLRATLHNPLGVGVYHVQWRAVGDDNHPMTGEYSFTIR